MTEKTKIMEEKTKTKRKKVQAGVWLDPQLYRLTKHKAVDEDLSIGAIVEKALRKYLAVKEK